MDDKATDKVLAELLPCPFCGTAAELTEDDQYGSCMIVCNNDQCPAQSFIMLPKERLQEAISKWNTRVRLSDKEGR